MRLNVVDRFLNKEEGSNRTLSDYEKTILSMCKTDDSDDDEDLKEEKEKMETNSEKPIDKFWGIRLYARFHSYYESKTKTADNLEEAHLEILEKLNEFSLCSL